MQNLNKHLLFGANILLTLAVVFQKKVTVPAFLQIGGRLHPMLLHAPIVLVFIVALLYYFQNKLERQSFLWLFKKAIFFTAVCSSLTALSGLLLSKENSGDLRVHMYGGLLLSWGCYLAFELQNKILTHKVWANSFWALLSYGTIWVGHLGASITHGAGFLLPQNERETDSPNTVFSKSIAPIFSAKCNSCHNNQKSKGGLNLSSLQGIAQGGKSGPLFIKGDSVHSKIIQVLTLPINHKKHMPPQDKPQLSVQELTLIKHWLAEGAKLDERIDKISEKSYFKYLKNSIIAKAKVYDFEPASAKDIAEANTPFCNVTALSGDAPALKAAFFVRAEYQKNALQNLKKVKKQLVSLSLSKMPVGDEIFDEVLAFENLEELYLNQTNISGQGIEKLQKLSHLHKLSLANNKLLPEVAVQLAKIKSLQEVYLWESGISQTIVQKNLAKGIRAHFGYVPDSTEKLKLNPPMMANEKNVLAANEAIVLKHTLKSAKIHFVTDTSSLDSSKGMIYTKPLKINNFTKLKALATLPGWRASEQRKFNFFVAGKKASKASLASKADPQYPGIGAAGLIDGKQGDIGNFKHSSWLAVRDNDFVCEFAFLPNTRLNGFTISYGLQPGAHIMPPQWVEVYTQAPGEPMVLFQKIFTKQPTKMQAGEVDGIDIKLGNRQVEIIKIIAKPLPKLPTWHPKKGEKGWFFVDELFFY